MTEWVHEVGFFFRLRWYIWKHRNDTKEQQQANFKQSKENLREAWANLKMEFDSDPATKEIHEAYEGMEEVFRELDK